jgi:hypothetical protein
MKTAPAGIPITTGHGRLVVDDEGATGGPGGLGSAKETKEKGKERNVIAGTGRSAHMWIVCMVPLGSLCSRGDLSCVA